MISYELLRNCKTRPTYTCNTYSVTKGRHVNKKLKRHSPITLAPQEVELFKIGKFVT